jgi:F420-non-reducing hydrogenase small subunit
MADKKSKPTVQPQGKLKLGLYWAASCGGCEIAVLEIGDRVLTLAEKADILFWPCVMDFKYDDVRAMPDGHMDVCLFNGGIRNDEQQEIAELLRKKSKVMVAFGSCSHLGGIPSLANLYSLQDLMDTVYKDNPSTENPDNLRPQEFFSMPEGEVHIPALHEIVKPLDSVVDVDYYIPGCPPVADRIWDSILAIVTGKLPPKGSVIGAGDKSVCDECPFEKKEVKIKRFYRPHELKPEPDWCLLEQGLVCMGPATRSGCEARCLQANMPCRGCYGPVAGVDDQGGAIISAIGSMIDTDDDTVAAEIIGQIADPAGTFYRFGLGASILRRARL